MDLAGGNARRRLRARAAHERHFLRDLAQPDKLIAADLAEGDDGLAKALRAIVDCVSVMPARQAPEIRIEGHLETLLKRSFGECPLPGTNVVAGVRYIAKPTISGALFSYRRAA